MSGEVTPRAAHQSFIRYVMSDVYALLDYLSGRATPPIVPPGPVDGPRARAAHHDTARGGCGRHGAEDLNAIEADLIDKCALLSRAMQIGQQVEAGSVNPTDAAFLILARDALNRQAAPAAGSTISFTIRVVHKLLGRGGSAEAARVPHDYLIEDEALDRAAAALARFVTRQVQILYVLLTVTVLLSTYVASGKLLLDTRDAVNRDFGNNVAAIMSETKQQPSALRPLNDVDTTYEWIEVLCQGQSPSAALNLACGQHHELKVRKGNIHELLGRWMLFQRYKALPDEEGVQLATTVTGIIGNYILPLLYGWLGALGYVLRRLNRQLADYLLTPRELRANVIRIVLGLVTGACIGLFVNNSTGASTLSGLGGAAVTLSASGIAFLAGYGVETVFKLVDKLIDHIFRTSDDPRGRTPA